MTMPADRMSEALLEEAHRAGSRLRRFANDSIRDAAGAVRAADEKRYTFLCECGDLRCHRTVEMTIREYERHRRKERLKAHLGGAG
jgi:hypothetical protein